MIRKVTAGDASELHWFKSSHSSSSEPSDCVEVAHDWRKSSHSSSSNGEDCVEVARAPRKIHIRDSKVTAGPHLTVTPVTWAGFLAYATTR